MATGLSVIPHEFGHNLGLNHVRVQGCPIPAGACIPPNAADCYEIDAAGDLMSYCPDNARNHYGRAAYDYLRNTLQGFMCEDKRACSAPFTK